MTRENHHVTEENPRLLRRGYLSVLHSRSLFFSPAPQSVLRPRTPQFAEGGADRDYAADSGLLSLRSLPKYDVYISVLRRFY